MARYGVTLVIIVAALMVISPIAMAAPGIGSLGADSLDDIGVGEVQTQSVDDVVIADELADEAEREDAVHVFVRLDVEASDHFDEHADDLETPVDVQDALEQEAALSQQPLVAFAEDRPGLEVLNQFWVVNAVLLEADSSLVEEIAQVDGVTELHPNYELELIEPEVDLDLDEPSQLPSTYGLEQIHAPDFWDDFGATGEGTTIAIIDTGVDPDHNEFPDYDPANWAMFDFEGQPIDSEPFDVHGHGTHVAGTALGSGGGLGINIGVAPGAELYAINVFPGMPEVGFTSLAAIVAGIEEAIDEGADVANLSLGGDGFAAVYIELIKNAKASGTLIVSSSGNAGPGTDGTPANVYNATAIGATTEAGDVVGFSTGTEVDTQTAWGYVAPESWPDEYVTPDVAAPGVSVISSVPDDGYALFSGTSMAAPHVSGAAALLMAEYGLEPSEVKSILEDTATKPHPDDISDAVIADAMAVSQQQALNLFDDDVRDARYGFGIVDVHAAGVQLDADSATIEGSVTHDDTPVPGLAIDVSPGPASGIADADGTFAIDVLPGTYEVSTSIFGQTAAEEVTVDAGETGTVDLELEAIVDAMLVGDQPNEAPANASFDVDFEVANLDEYTVELADGADVDADDLALTLDGDAVELGEPVAFDEPVDGPLTLEVDQTADEGDTIELAHTLAGPGDDVMLTSGPTSVLHEDAQPALVEITEFDPPDEVFFNAPSPLFIELHNPGDFTESVELFHVVDIFGAGNGPFLVVIPAEVGPGETKEVMLGPYNWWVVGPAGTEIAHMVAVNDFPSLFGGAPDDETGIHDLLLTGAGPIGGTVTDADTGEAVTGATVTAESPGGQTFSATTDADGTYTITGPTELGEYTVTADVEGGYAPASDTVEVDPTAEPVTLDLALDSEAIYTLSIEAGTPTAVGIPGPLEAEKIADLITEEVTGVIYTYDAGANAWALADAETEVGALDAFVVIAEEDVTATIELADSDDLGLPSQRPVEAGWNFVAASKFAPPSEAFLGTSDAQIALQLFDQPATSMVPAGEFAGFEYIDGADGDAVTPMSGYFVFFDDDGLQASALTDEGHTLAEANDRLFFETERVAGTLEGMHSGDAIDDATIRVDGAPYVAEAGPDGSFGFNHLATDEPPTISVEADGYVDDAFEVTDGATLALQEETFFAVTAFEATETAAVGDEIVVTYEVTNLGAEAAEKVVEVSIGPDPEFARLDPATHVLDTRTIALDAGESVEVTITDEVGPFQPGGMQEIAVITDATAFDFDDVASQPFTVIGTAFADQALGEDADENPAVVAGGVSAEAGSFLLVTYLEGTGEDVVVGMTELDEAVTEANVAVEIEDFAAFPGEHHVHVVSELSDKSANDTIGSVLSAETKENIQASASAHLFDAELEFEDQGYEAATDEVVVDVAAVLDGIGDETPFTIDLHPTDDDGMMIPDEAVGQSDVLMGAHEDVTIHLDEPIDATDEFVAMIHLGAAEEPLTTPALVQAMGDALVPVMDGATVEVGTNIAILDLVLEDNAAGDEGTYELEYAYTSTSGEDDTAFLTVDFGDDSVDFADVEPGDISISGPQTVSATAVSAVDDATMAIELDTPIEAETGDVYDVSIAGVTNAEEVGEYVLTLATHAEDEGDLGDAFAMDAATYELIIDVDAQVMGTLSAEDADDVGDMVTATYDITSLDDDEREVAGFFLVVDYNADVLAFDEATAVDYVISQVHDEDGTVSILGIDTANPETPFEPAIELTFEAVAEGVSDLAIDADESDIMGPGAEPYDPAFVDDSVTVGDPAPEFAVSDLDPAEATVNESEAFDVSATVENVGTLAGETDVELRLDGDTLETTSVALDVGEAETVTFADVSVDEAGEYNHSIWTADDEAVGSLTVVELEPEFAVSDLDPDDATVNVSEAFDVSATVENVGDAAGTTDVELRLDGDPIANTTVTLDPGASTAVTFENASVDEAGEYELSVWTADDAAVGSLTVEEPTDNSSVGALAGEQLPAGLAVALGGGA